MDGLTDIPKKQILIIKVGALGDVLRTTFLPQLLRRKYGTDSMVTWLTHRNALSLLEQHPFVDHVAAFQDVQALTELQKQSYDLVLSLDDEHEISQFASSLQTKEFHGAYLDASGKQMYTASVEPWFGMGLLRPVELGGKQKADALKVQNRKTFQEIFTTMLGLSSVLMYVKDTKPIIHLTLAELQHGHVVLEKYHLTSAKLIVGINAGAGVRWSLKWLSEEKAAALADALVRNFNASVLLLGGIDEIERNRRTQHLCVDKEHVVAVEPTHSIKQFAGVVNICDLVITSDSLALHLALALDKKTTAFFGPTSPYEIEMFGLGEKVFKESSCLSCYRKDSFENSCISLLTSQDILSAAQRALHDKTVMV